MAEADDVAKDGAEKGAQSGGGLCGCLACAGSTVVSIGCCLCIGVIVLVVLLWYFVWRTGDEVVTGSGGLGLDDFGNVLDDLEINDNWGNLWDQEQPEPTQGELTPWRKAVGQEQGLHLELVNSLDSSWQDIFDTSVADWQQSDVVTLTTTDSAVDRECTFVDGVMKVCFAKDSRRESRRWNLILSFWRVPLSIFLKRFAMEITAKRDGLASTNCNYWTAPLWPAPPK